MLKTLLLSLLLLVPLGASAAELRDAQSFFTLNMGDLKAEAADAKAEKKKAILVMFEQEGCPGCRHMRTQVLNHKEVQDYYRANFANLSLDIWSSVPIRDFAGKEQTEKAFAQATRVKGTPTFVFYDLAGNEISRVFGVVETPEEFLLLGRYISSGAYKTRDFAQFKQTLARKGN
ncbi:MAG TPA: thioredoxin family protein [Burkholderiales bacterium]|nr:thioredoxin family protein [Burkholderiales bacterium]